jgi:hypothetical protein
MSFITEIPSSANSLILCVALACTILWVAYSIQEFLVVFRKHQKKRSIRHNKELELYRQELKK